MKSMTKSVVRKLKKMWVRTIGISLVISMAMAMLLAGLYSGEVFDYSTNKYFEDNKMPDIFYEYSSPQNQTEVENTLQNIDDVKSYQLRLRTGGSYDWEGESYTVLVYGIDDPGQNDINVMNLDSGRYYSDRTGALAITGMEDKGIDSGNDVELILQGNSINITVTGIVSSPEYMFPTAQPEYSIPIGGNIVILFLDLQTVQDLIGFGVNDVLVLLTEDGSADEVTSALEPFGIQKMTEKNEHPSKLYMDIGAAKMRGFFPIIALIFMIVGFISIFMTIYRLVKSDSRYIGVMMSLGYTRRQIVWSYMSLAIVITIIGGTLGTLFGLGLTQSVVEISMSMYKNMQLTLPFSPMPFLLSWIYILITIVFSVWIPVTLITRTSVREALDYKPKMRVKSTRAFSSRFSKMTTMGLRNSFRNPGRAILTYFVVGMTIGVAGSWAVMTDSAFGYMVEQWDADKWDLRGDFAMPVSEAEINESFLGLQPGDTESIIPFVHMSGEVRRGGNEQGSIIIGCNDLKNVRDFELETGELDFSRAVITFNLAEELNIEPGENIEIDVGGNSVDLEVSGVVYDVMALTVYMERSNVQSLLGSDNVTGVFVTLNNVDYDFVKQKAASMRASPMVIRVVVQDEIAKTLTDVMDQAFAMLYFFFFVCIIIAFVVAGSAVIISAMERDVEFAAMDTLGISKGKIAKSIIIEMGVLAFFSSIIGVPLSYFFGWLMAKVMEEILFFFPIVLVIGGSIITFLMGFVFVMISSLIPIRYFL